MGFNKRIFIMILSLTLIYVLKPASTYVFADEESNQNEITIVEQDAQADIASSTDSDQYKTEEDVNEIVYHQEIVDKGNYIEYYYIIFDGNGNGDVTGVMEPICIDVPDNTMDIPECNYTHLYGSFKEWNTERDGSGESYFPGEEIDIGSIDEDITLYAQWGPKKYNITYVNAKTNMDNPEYYYTSSESIMLEKPTGRGYTFNGWYYDSELTRKATMIKANSKGDKTFYAKWTMNKYTIIFDGNGSTSGTMNDMTCRYSAKYTLRNNKFKKKGYDFAGWNTKANGSGKALTNQEVIQKLNSTSGGIVTLYAQWKPHEYSIVFKGYRAESGSMNKVYYKYGETYKLPVNGFRKKGYVLKGWNTKADGSGRKFTDQEMVSNLTAVDGKVITLYTQWEKAQYKIVYGLRGGINDPMNPTSYNISTNTITLKNPTRMGYIFDGWYSDSAYTTKITEIPKGSYGKKCLYAKWIGINNYITYFTNGGTLNKAPNVYYYDTETFLIPEPIRVGYKFAGWYCNSDFSGNRVYSINKGSMGNVSLYAKWVPITYKVVFNGNGANSGYVEGMTCEYGKTYTFPKNNFVKSACDFLGWGQYSNKTDSIYGNEFSNLSTVEGSTVIVYAQWSKQRCIVKTNPLPKTVHYRYNPYEIASSAQVIKVSYTTEENWNGKYDIYITVTTKKTYNNYDYGGTVTIGANYALKNSSNLVVYSGYYYHNYLVDGESFEWQIKIYGVDPGEYFLDFRDLE